MSLETIGQHIAGIRHTEAATRNINAATETEDALRGGRVKSLDLSNEQAGLMLSELYKNAELADWARKNQIHHAKALNEYITNDKEGFYAGIAVVEDLKRKENDFKLVEQQANSNYLKLDSIRAELRNIIAESPDLTPEDMNIRMNNINVVYDNLITSWRNNGVIDESDLSEDGIYRADGILPGGISQGDPLTINHLPTINFSTNVNGRMSSIAREEQEKLREKAPSLKDMVDTQGKLTTVGGQKTDLMLENIWGTFPETAEVTDTGKRTADDWESANTILSQVLEGAMTDTGDPMADAQKLQQFMRESLGSAKVDFDAKGFGGGDVYTYAPSSQLGTFQGPGGIPMSRDIYINMLKEAIHLKSEEDAQNIANQMFINMVTSLPR
tara:strand:- start:4519 stop:5673 length:1155 start_codon:yes stop_codon:yes gene_type:complete